MATQWHSVLRRGRSYLADAQVPVEVRLSCTYIKEAALEGDLPFTFVQVGGAGGCAGGKDNCAGGVCDTDEEDDEGESGDDAGDDVLGVAFTLLNATARDATLGAEERARVAMLQAMVDVFFYAKGRQSATAVARRLAAVGNGAMALALWNGKHGNLDSNDARIADAKFELLQQLSTTPSAWRQVQASCHTHPSCVSASATPPVPDEPYVLQTASGQCRCCTPATTGDVAPHVISDLKALQLGRTSPLGGGANPCSVRLAPVDDLSAS